MSNYELLKTAIDAVIKANGRAEITGSIMNQTLMAMVNSLGRGYQFIGVATPEINPNTPDEKVFYLAMQAGTYTNFGNITLNTGLTVLKWDGEWHALTVFSTDTTPTHDSANLITSGAVYNAIKNDGGAYDVSVHFPTGGEGGGNTYTLANAIAKVPVNMRKGGMSIKFIDAATNKYAKHTFLNPTTDGFTNVNNWQGIIESAAGFHTIGSAKNHQLASVGALVEEFGIKCVNELPTASASTMNKIYSIPTAHPVAGKRRDEYFTVETGIAPDYTDVKDLVTVTAIPDNALGAQVGEGKFIANDTTNNKAYYFVSVRALNEWGYEVTVEEVASGKIARMLNESQYASNGTAWVIDYHYADYTWESLSPDLSSLATKSEVEDVAHALELTARDCENMTSIEYDELVQLRDDGELIPGKWYRIVDYHTTTAQEDTQSADHQFDVIVKADSTNVLNENAFAAINEDDAYFTDEGAKLEAWQLKYCLDNDSNRFAWADDRNGKGVIYWMRDEWGNECPYDFKNIMFIRCKCNYNGRQGVYFAIPNVTVGKNDQELEAQDDNDTKYLYTFNEVDRNGVCSDASVTTTNVFNAKIEPYIEESQCLLNNIVITSITNYTISCRNIIIKDNSMNCTFIVLAGSTIKCINNSYIAEIWDSTLDAVMITQFICDIINNSSFSNSYFELVDIGSSLDYVNLMNVEITGVSLKGASHTSFENSNISNTDILANVSHSSFVSAYISTSVIGSNGKNLKNSNFNNAKIEELQIVGDIERVDFSNSYIYFADFGNATIKRDMRITYLEFVRFIGANVLGNIEQNCHIVGTNPTNREEIEINEENYLQVITNDGDATQIATPYI